MFALHQGPFIDIAKKMHAKPTEVEEMVIEKGTISEIKPNELEPFKNLQYIYFTGNNIEILNNLDHNIRLKIIDARNNKIRDVDLTNQHFLEELYLADNCLHDLQSFIKKVSHIKDLQILDLRNNSLALENQYRSTVISAFPALRILDGHPVTLRERQRGKVGTATRNLQTTRRPRSILQCLQERPMSAADANVRRKANTIRRDRDIAEKEEQERLTAAARKRKEEFEQKARNKDIPMPEELDFLGQAIRRAEALRRKPAETPRPHTRMFLKAPVYTKAKELSPEEERAVRLNPNLPAVFNAKVQHRIMYPGCK